MQVTESTTPGHGMTRLEQLRLDAGLSRNGLGRLTRVHHMTIARIERGERPVQTQTLAKLSTHFGVKASELLMDALPPERPARRDLDSAA